MQRVRNRVEAPGGGFLKGFFGISSRTRPPKVETLALAFIALVLGFVATRDAWARLLATASASAASMAALLLVPGIAIWLAWARRHRFERCFQHGKPFGVLILASGAFLYHYGRSEPALHQLGAVLVLLGCVAGVLGTSVLRWFAPALAAAFFTVPVPEGWTSSLEGTVGRFAVAGTAEEGSGSLAGAIGALKVMFLISFAVAFGSPLRLSARLLVLSLAPASVLVWGGIGLLPPAAPPGELTLGAVHGLPEGGLWIVLPLHFFLLRTLVETFHRRVWPLREYRLAQD